MQTQSPANKSLHPLIWVAGVALILFSAVGIGAFMGWIPTSIADPDDKASLEAQAEDAVAPTPAVPVTAKARAAPVRKKTAVQIADSDSARADNAASRCSACGVVETVRAVETKGEGSGLGAVGGGVVGGLLGNRVGGGRGQDVMTVVGVVGGAMAGNEIEKRSKSSTSYAITVRFDDGSSRTFNEANGSAWQVGDKVKVVNGAIQFNN